jgi:hypothetical protein
MDATTRVDHQRPPRWLDRHLHRLGEALFAGADDHAVQHGWDITVRQRGLSRTYRDPRSELLVVCPICDGAGADDFHAPACPTCRGRGRVLPAAHAALAGER